jgi:HKD family nuclease
MHHVISDAESIRARLLDRLETCSDGVIATAFFTHGAFQELKDAIRAALNRGATLRFLIGRYDYVTDPNAVKELLRLGTQKNSQLQVRFDADFLFHYKLALFRDEGRYVVIVGSSNLTPNLENS